MLSKMARVRTHREVESVLKRGLRAPTPLFVLFVCANTIREQRPRVGFIVSNKISKKATVRNRIKRRMREAARLYLQLFPRQTDSIMLARAAIVNAPFHDIQKTLADLLRTMPERLSYYRRTPYARPFRNT